LRAVMGRFPFAHLMYGMAAALSRPEILERLPRKNGQWKPSRRASMAALFG
jgi:hypothetical protein